MEKKSFKVAPDSAKLRLDVFLNQNMAEQSRSQLKNLIKDGLATVNGKAVKAGFILRENDLVELTVPPNPETDIKPEALPLDIIFEDDQLLVINKAQGMVVHPSSNCFSGTLVNALLGRKELSTVNGIMRPGIVHRLDKDTSGLMLVAKNDTAHRNLARQIEEKSCVREYLALLNGRLGKDEGHIETYIARDPKDRKKMCVPRKPGGKLARTNFVVEKRFDKFTLVRFRLETGRTHQIRVHAKHMGFSVVGDPVYSKGAQMGQLGQLLHSCYIEFTHPITGERLSFSAPLPKYFKNILSRLDTSGDLVA